MQCSATSASWQWPQGRSGGVRGFWTPYCNYAGAGYIYGISNTIRQQCPRPQFFTRNLTPKTAPRDPNVLPQMRLTMADMIGIPLPLSELRCSNRIWHGEVEHTLCTESRIRPSYEARSRRICVLTVCPLRHYGLEHGIASPHSVTTTCLASISVAEDNDTRCEDAGPWKTIV